MARYLCSEDFLEPFWRLGHFVPNVSAIQTDVQFERLITRPWDATLAEDLEAVSVQLTSLIDT
jgi:hypothetical protein